MNKGVQLVGVDYFSVEQFHSGHHRTHLTLLKNDVVIVVEGLALSRLLANISSCVCRCVSKD